MEIETLIVNGRLSQNAFHSGVHIGKCVFVKTQNQERERYQQQKDKLEKREFCQRMQTQTNKSGTQVFNIESEF